jgi:hypothetical protein
VFASIRNINVLVLVARQAGDSSSTAFNKSSAVEETTVASAICHNRTTLFASISGIIVDIELYWDIFKTSKVRKGKMKLSFTETSRQFNTTQQHNKQRTMLAAQLTAVHPLAVKLIQLSHVPPGNGIDEQ